MAGDHTVYARNGSAAVVAKRLPSIYRSETLIQVVPQRIPESYVRSTVTTRIEDRLGGIQQMILSRSRLERIINDFNLYQEDRRVMVMEDVVARMRDRDVNVRVERGDAFRVSYIAGDPRVAQKVAERLGSLFIDENLRDREALAEQTSQFLEGQLDDARRRLLEHEKKLETYRRSHSGELPTQQQANVLAIQNAQMQLQSLAEAHESGSGTPVAARAAIGGHRGDRLGRGGAAPDDRRRRIRPGRTCRPPISSTRRLRCAERC